MSLAAARDMAYYFGPALKLGPVGFFGNAVLSRYPLLAHRNYRLPGRLEPRCCLRVLLRAPGGYLVVLSTHLGLKRDERTEQIRELRRMVENERYPVILMGDFNCGLDQLGPLNEVLTDTGGLFGAAATFPSAGPAHRIDYIMTSPVLYCRNMYIPLIDASDHLPVVAELTF